MKPSIYSKWVKSDVLKFKLRDMRDYKSHGLTEEQIALKLGVHHTTLINMKKVHKDVEDAMELGNEGLKDELTNALYTACVGHSKKIITRVYRFDEKGENKHMFELKEGELYFPPSETALKFMMPMKFGRDYSDKRYDYELKEKIIEASKDPDLSPQQSSNFTEIFKEAVGEYEDVRKTAKKK